MSIFCINYTQINTAKMCVVLFNKVQSSLECVMRSNTSTDGQEICTLVAQVAEFN